MKWHASSPTLLRAALAAAPLLLLAALAAAQNVYLQAAALGLGTTFMGSYNDSAMTRVLGADVRPMGVMPVGKPR